MSLCGRYRGNVMQMVKLESLQDWETLPLTKWLIRQPSVHDVRDDAMETGKCIILQLIL